MTFSEGALLYLFLSRMLIVAAAIICLILGFRLFARDSRGGSADAKSTIETSVAGVRFTIRDAAPGTAFATFGAILIVVMLVQSSPLVTLNTVSKFNAMAGPAAEGAPVPASSERSTQFTARGEGRDAITSLTNEGIELEKRKDRAGAERAYRDAVTTMAEPMNDLAWIYLKSGRAKEALGLAELAVKMRPDEPRYLDTLKQTKLEHPQ